jgi:hypothetical protein
MLIMFAGALVHYCDQTAFGSLRHCSGALAVLHDAVGICMI